MHISNTQEGDKIMTYSGEIAAILTAVCWAITSVSFESGGKKIGSLNLNLVRLLFGLAFLSTYTLFSRGYLIPIDASSSTWFWLFISGIVGIVLGDLLLFEAFVRIGARTSMLIYASVPPLSGIISYFILGEAMTFMQIIGMIITTIGICIVILDNNGEEKKMKLNHPLLGILLAFGGALGQALGYVIGKYGLKSYDPFAATQIRLIAGIISFSLIFTIKGHWPAFISIFKKPKQLQPVVIGSFFGPFIGISISLYAVQRINPGVASTLTSITPILLIPYAMVFKKEHVDLKEIIGSVIAITGLAVLFL